eukprot:CAMPEP_0181492664 /NCGR_PEP_ID=MMETSP1110-20121109/50807_1 /TAXON_ID=174948 /ORGANISM="Symbiodinium sp., Strain CCMP421" /LENGTH=89 /DNA_ID=CAMNT_0023619921 /DNA_START=950 /DNA_END=1216 /DNA_ORIENTATION=+
MAKPAEESAMSTMSVMKPKMSLAQLGGSSSSPMQSPVMATTICAASMKSITMDITLVAQKGGSHNADGWLNRSQLTVFGRQLLALAGAN